MAKKAKNYPVIPRVRFVKGPGRDRLILVDEPVYTPRIIHADRLTYATQNYVKNWINVDSKQLQGTNTKSGTKNPDWRVTIAKGGDATSNYSRIAFFMKPTSYRVVSSDSLNLSRGSGVLHGGSLTSQPDPTPLEDKAIGRLRNKLQGHIGNAQLGPPLAESREIHRLIRQINGIGMSSFRALLAAIPKGNFRDKGLNPHRTLGLTRQLSDIWLMFGFGINPLLQDLKSAADSVMKYVSRQDYRVVVTGSASRDYSSGALLNVSSSEYISAHTSMGWCLASDHVQSVRYIAGVDIKVRTGGNYSVADHLGLQVGALPSILWELTPYSWAIDYFTTVGQWLDDTFYTLPVNVVYVLKNYKYHCVTRGTPVGINIPGSTSTVTGNASIGRYLKFTRVKLVTSLPTRSLRIKTMDEIASHGLTKLLNLGSVIAGRRGAKF